MDKDNLITAAKIRASYVGLDGDHKIIKDIVVYHNENMKDVFQWGTLKNLSPPNKLDSLELEDSESFNCSYRHDCLNINRFFSIEDAQENFDHWIKDYN